MGSMNLISILLFMFVCNNYSHVSYDEKGLTTYKTTFDVRKYINIAHIFPTSLKNTYEHTTLIPREKIIYIEYSRINLDEYSTSILNYKKSNKVLAAVRKYWPFM